MNDLKIKSSDGQVFNISLAVALKFGTLGTMFKDLGADFTSHDETIYLQNINSRTLNKMIDWATNRSKLTAEQSVDWDENYFQVEPAYLFEIMMAADFLDIEDLLDCGCRVIARMIAGRSLSDLKKLFNCKSDMDITEEDFEVDQNQLTRFLKEVPFCLFCNNSSSNTLSLKTCARCQLVKYCSADCQKKDYAKHKRICREVKRLTDLTRQDRANDNSYPSAIQYELLDTIHKLGRTVSDKNILLKCLSLCLRELEVGGESVPGRAWVGSKIPFLLLELDRDEAAYAFIKSFFDKGAKDLGREDPSLSNQSSYFGQQDLTEDFPEVTGRPWSKLGLAFLAALALIKARLIVKSTIAKSQFEVFQRFIEAENVAISLKSSPVVDKIRSYAIPCVSEKLEKQKQDFEDLLDLIDGENRIFLSAIINPEPLLSQDPPNRMFNDSTDAYFPISDCQLLFARNSYAMKSITRRVGRKPMYKVKMETIKVM